LLSLNFLTISLSSGYYRPSCRNEAQSGASWK